MSQPIRPLIANVSDAQAIAILGAMRAIGETGRGWTASDALALGHAAPFMLGYNGPLDQDHVPAIAPTEFAEALSGSTLPDDAVKLLTVMALVDAPMDKAKLDAALAFAKAVDIHGRYLDEIAEAAGDRIKEALADMTRANMDSILGHPWEGGNAEPWLLPYTGAHADPKLSARFEALGKLGADTFGRRFWVHFKENNYAFPGDPKGLNALFAVPHDSVHVLTGYDTTGRGEILASTFTASMHRRYPMAGHILPVIFSWHLKIQINAVAGSFEGALDPSEVWRAWAAGAQCPQDSFSPQWSFWDHVESPIADVRQGWLIPPQGLAAGMA